MPYHADPAPKGPTVTMGSNGHVSLGGLPFAGFVFLFKPSVDPDPYYYYTDDYGQGQLVRHSGIGSLQMSGFAWTTLRPIPHW